MRTKITATLLLIIFPSIVLAVEYKCSVIKKLDSEHEYTSKEISQGNFSVLIKENSDTSYLSRCSFVRSENKVTCDRYKVNKVSIDENAKIKKYYVFNSHFDVQLFSNLTFIENNGRGGIGFGKCQVVAP